MAERRPRCLSLYDFAHAARISRARLYQLLDAGTGPRVNRRGPRKACIAIRDGLQWAIARAKKLQGEARERYVTLARNLGREIRVMHALDRMEAHITARPPGKGHSRDSTPKEQPAPVPGFLPNGYRLT